MAAADLESVCGAPQKTWETKADVVVVLRRNMIPAGESARPTGVWPLKGASVETRPAGVTARTDPKVDAGTASASTTTPLESTAMPPMAPKRALVPRPFAFPTALPASVETVPLGVMARTR